ncbi:MAG: hypothetical protein U1F43_35630 [Myxococcota bacterium]
MRHAVLTALATPAAALALAGCDADPTAATLARECVRDARAEPSGALTQHLVDVYDDGGRRVSSRLETTDPAWPAATTTRTFDADGRLQRETTSGAGALGGPFERAYSYDARGRLLSLHLTGAVPDAWARQVDLQYADSGAGPVRIIVATGLDTTTDTLAYDARDRLAVRLREVRAAAHPAPESLRDSFAYDAAGRLVEVQRDQGADGSVETVFRRELDADGRVLRSGRFDPGGDWIEGTVYTYDGDRVSEVRWDSTLDGLDRWVLAYAAGVVATVDRSHGADGPVDERLELSGGRPGADCADSATEATRAPLERFYTDPAADLEAVFPAALDP